MKLFFAVLLVSIIFSVVFMLFNVHATTTETRYMTNGNAQTVNGLYAAALATTQSSTSESDLISIYSGNVFTTQYLGVEPYKRDSAGTETNLTNGVVAIASASSSGLISATWTCPQTAMVPTDAIRLYIYGGDSNPPASSIGYYITEQLGGSSLNASTWTIYYYLLRAYSSALGGQTNYYFYYGSSSYNSHLEGFAWNAYSAGTASANWANTNLAYRQSVVITSASGAGVSYQINITMVNGSSSSLGPVMYENNSMRNDFGDVRFYSNDNSTNLNYWQQTVNTKVNSTFWVQMPADNTYGNLSSTNQVVWVYYGNSTMTTASNIVATFPTFADDFRADSTLNTTDWTQHGGTATFDSTNGLKLASSGVATLQSASTISFATYKKVITEFEMYGGSSYNANLFVDPTSNTGDVNSDDNWTRMSSQGAGNSVYFGKRVSSITTWLYTGTGTGYHVFIEDLLVSTSNAGLTFYYDGTQKYSNSSEKLWGTTSCYLYPCISANGGTYSLYMKYIAVAKYVSSEPGNGAWTAEELCRPAISITVTSSSTGAGYVTVDGNAITTPQTYSWVAGDYHKLSANSPANLVSGQNQYLYSSWNDSGTQQHWITVPSSTTIYTASFQLQYYLTVTGGNAPSGQGWYNSGVSATASNTWVWNTVGGQNRTALTNWQLDTVNKNPSRSNTGNLTTSSITMSTYHTANFVSATQYYLTVTGGNSVSYGTASPTSDNWYDSGSSTTVSSDWVWGTVSGQSRTVLTNWQEDGVNQGPTRQNSGSLTTSSVSMTTYHTVTFVSTTQYYNTLNTAISGATVSQSGSQFSDNWYDSGTNTTVSATSPYTNGTTNRFLFTNWTWTLGGASQTNMTGNPANITMSNYISITACWNYDIVVLYDQNITVTRVNVNATETIRLRYKWESDSTVLSSGWVLQVNGTAHTTDSSGWTNFTDSCSTVGNRTYQLTNANSGSNYLNNITASIVWDKINVMLSASARVNVNSSASITESATYEYDGTGSNGTVNLNDTTLKSTVAKYYYTAVSVTGDSYGITVFDTNTINVIFDNVTVTLSPPSSRINVGSTASISEVSVLQYDGTSYDGSISLNDTIVKNSVGIWNYTTASLSGGTYGITVFGSNTVQVIFDEVTINTFSVAHNRINVNSSASFTVAGVYCYDNGVWSGTYFLNDTAMKSGEGKYWLTIASITDSNYGLTVFNMSAGSISVTWDSLIVYNLQSAISGSSTTYTSQIIYGYNGLGINNATVGLLYPNGTLVTAYSNSSGWASFTISITSIPGGICTIYGINDNNYGITIAVLNETFGGVQWALQTTDVNGNVLSNTTVTVTSNALPIWSGAGGTSIFVGTGFYNVSVTWLQGITVNVTFNVAVSGNQTSIFNCTCYLFTVGGNRYWFAGNATVSTWSYANSEITVNFMGPTGNYVLIDSCPIKPTYILNCTYDLATAFSSGYLILNHYGNETLVVGYDSWGGLYVASTNHEMGSVSMTSFVLGITEMGNTGTTGCLTIYCGGWGAPASQSGFVTVTYSSSTLSATGSFVFVGNSTVLQLTFSGGSASGSTGGPSGPPAVLLITPTLNFPKEAKPGDVLNGTLNVQWTGMSIISLYAVNPVGMGDWTVNVLEGLPITLTMQNGAGGNVTVTILLTVPENASIGDNEVPFDIVFSALGETTKTIRITMFITVISPVAASLPSPQNMLTISSLLLFFLFLSVIMFRRSKKPRIP